MPVTINSLAPETLGEIFLHAFHSQTVKDWNTTTLPNLLLVSQRWNAVIESLPVRWTSVLVTEKAVYPLNDPLFQSTCSRLRRSRDYPLNIAIRLPKEIDPHFDEEEAEELGNIINNVASRLESLSLHAYPRTLQTSILSEFYGTRMPILRSFTHIGCEDPALSLQACYRGFIKPEDYYNVPAILLWEGIDDDRAALTKWGAELYPALEEVKIVGALYDWGSFPTMRGLRRLSLHNQPKFHRIAVFDFMEMLKPVRETLEVLELTDILRVGPDAPGERVLFKKLTVLSVGYDHTVVALYFFLSCEFPRVVDLTLTHTSAGRDLPFYDPTFPHHDLLGAVLGSVLSFDLLKRVTLNGVVFPNEELSKVEIPRPGKEVEPERLEYLMDECLLWPEQFRAFCGHWTMPLAMFFLYKFKSLKYLSVNNLICSDGKENILRMMGRYWQEGTLATLEELHFDGPPEGVLDLLSAVEKEKALGFRPLPLAVTVGEKLEGALSEKEKVALQQYTKALGNV